KLAAAALFKRSLKNLHVERSLFVAALGKDVPQVVGGVDADLHRAAEVQVLLHHLAAGPPVVADENRIPAGKVPGMPAANDQRLFIDDEMKIARVASVV